MMDDDFDRGVRRRLLALDAAVPESASVLDRPPRQRSHSRTTSLTTGLPVGFLAVLIVAVGIAAAWNLQPRTSAAPSIEPSPTQSPSAIPSSPRLAEAGMTVESVRARSIEGIGYPVVVTATFQNTTGSSDSLVGASSPNFASSGLYGYCTCATPEPTDPTTGIAGMAREAGFPIPAGQTVSMAGQGAVVLYGAAGPLSVGDTIEITFKFMKAAPVTVRASVGS